MTPTKQIEEKEVEFEPGKDEDMGTAEDDKEVDVAKGLLSGTAADPAKEENKKEASDKPKAPDVIDILIGPEPKKREFGSDELGVKYEYMQEELSFVNKMRWYSLVGEALDKAMGGPDPLTINHLLDAPATGSLSLDTFRDADTFLKAIGKLISYSPDFLERSICIWLSVPEYEQPRFREVLAQPPSKGGLSDDEGLDILALFIEQNYESIERFFREKIGQLRRQIQNKREAQEEK